MISRISIAFIYILGTNFCFSQILTEKGIIQEQLACYEEILPELINDNITWSDCATPPVPPIPLEAIKNPTFNDSLRFSNEILEYTRAKEAYHKKKEVYIENSLFSINEFYKMGHDSCDFIVPELQNILVEKPKRFDKILVHSNYKYSSNKDSSIKLKLSRICFDDQKRNGYLIFQIEDMFGTVTTKCYKIKVESGKWKLL